RRQVQAARPRRFASLERQRSGGSPMTIRSPFEWSGEHLAQAAQVVRSASHSLQHVRDTAHSPAPAVRRITLADLRDALRLGYADFIAYRSDVLFIGVVYALVGLLLARVAFNMDLVPLLF